MEYLRLAGAVVGSLQILMRFNQEIHIHRRQCSILADVFTIGVDKIADKIEETLDIEERRKKWKFLEPALKELCRILQNGEMFIRQCCSYTPGIGKDWWLKVITLSQNSEGLDLHLHNFLWCISVVIDAIEIASEETSDEEENRRRRLLHCKKYDTDWLDRKLFECQFGKQYLVSPEIKSFGINAWRDDIRMLLETINSKMQDAGILAGLDRRDSYRVAEFLCRKLDDSVQNRTSQGKFPSCLMLESKEFHVKRRIGSGRYGDVKEITWMGEIFAMRHMFTNVEIFAEEITVISNLMHPNIMQPVGCLIDKERSECALVMEFMQHRDLRSFIKEKSTSPRKRNNCSPFSLQIALDIMLQIARGMEYLHMNNIIHGDLKPSNVLVKAGKPMSREFSDHVQVKISDFGLTNSNRLSSKYSSSTNADIPCCWRAPEVLNIRTEDDLPERKLNSCRGSLARLYTEKADVYGFGMICYEILTGKIPFDDVRSKLDVACKIRAGERPLLPSTCPRYISHLIRKCWHADQNIRPSFACICRILRHIRRKLFLFTDPLAVQADLSLPNLRDFYDIEKSLAERLPEWGLAPEFNHIANIPFQMFAFRVMEKENVVINSTADDVGNNHENHDDQSSERINGVKLITPRSPLNRSMSFNKKVLAKMSVDSKAHCKSSASQFKERAFQHIISPNRRRTSAAAVSIFHSSN